MKKIILFLLLPSLLFAGMQMCKAKTDTNNIIFPKTAKIVFAPTNQFTLYAKIKIDTAGTYNVYTSTIRTTTDSSFYTYWAANRIYWIITGVAATNNNLRKTSVVSINRVANLFYIKSGTTFDTTNIHVYIDHTKIDSGAAAKTGTNLEYISLGVNDSMVIGYKATGAPRITFYDMAIYNHALNYAEVGLLMAGIDPVLVYGCLWKPDLRARTVGGYMTANTRIADFTGGPSGYVRNKKNNTPVYVPDYPYLSGAGVQQ